jgi:hypothetical protein
LPPSPIFIIFATPPDFRRRFHFAIITPPLFIDARFPLPMLRQMIIAGEDAFAEPCRQLSYAACFSPFSPLSPPPPLFCRHYGYYFRHCYAIAFIFADYY